MVDLHEILANVFALELLIPKHILLALADNHHHPETYYPAWLAKAFQVSEGLMKVRMKEFPFNPAKFELEYGYIPPPAPPKPTLKESWEVAYKALQKWGKGLL